MPECPDSIEALQELEKLIPLCRVTIYNQAKARIESGAAKSVSEASRQLAEETGRSPNTIRSAINRECGTDAVRQLSGLSGTDKHRPSASSSTRVALGEKEILETAREIQTVKRNAKEAVRETRREENRAKVATVEKPEQILDKVSTHLSVV